MTECKHGLKQGCFYCHARPATTGTNQAAPSKRRSKATRLSEQMNERMSNLKQRLRQIRGE